MVPLLDLAASSHLLQEGHGGLEDIGALSKEGLQLLKVCELTLRIKPAVSQASAYWGPVLALHVTVVVLVVGTGTDNAPRLGQKGLGVKRIP